jgi:hypothetical protein
LAVVTKKLIDQAHAVTVALKADAVVLQLMEPIRGANPG